MGIFWPETQGRLSWYVQMNGFITYTYFLNIRTVVREQPLFIVGQHVRNIIIMSLRACISGKAVTFCIGTIV